MAKYNYPTYKILIDPHSKKVQGLKVGDVVRREYYDAPNLIYSLMAVLETGTELVGEADSAYFIGALIEGDEPKAGELLDFVRVTNLFDDRRGGAMYLTASDSDAPYMDVIDGMGRDGSLCWPTLGGAVNTGAVPSPDKYGINNISYFDGVYKESDGDVSRVYRLTSKRACSTSMTTYGIKVNLGAVVQNPQRILISYKARGSKEYSRAAIRFGYSIGATISDFTDTTSIGTDWRYYFAVFTVDYTPTTARSFYLMPSAEMNQIGDWVEIAELNIIPQSNIAEFSKASKTRIGKIQGVVDPVFGVLDGYGAYFQNLYATRNVNIAGTLTAGDENGFASTFYVGRIHKNVIRNSISPTYIGSPPVLANDPSPTGIGSAWQMGASAKLKIQSAEWKSSHIGAIYCFSIWIKSIQAATVSIFQNDHHIQDVSVNASQGWQRHYCSFRIQDSAEQGVFMRLASSLTGVMISSPQLEAGKRPSQYQATDSTLSYVEDYGAWFNKGGIGGTIQNPLLKLNGDGSISSRDDSFVINPDGTGHFSSGRFRWSKDTITLVDVTIRWEDLSEDARKNLKGETGNTGSDGKDGKDGEDAYSLLIHSSRGTIFHNGQVQTRLTAQVLKGTTDITAFIPDECFRWTRTSDDPAADALWSAAQHGGRILEIDEDDVAVKAVFDCQVAIPDNIAALEGIVVILRYPATQMVLEGEYAITGVVSNDNARSLTIADTSDIYNILTIDLDAFEQTDLSAFSGKEVYFYLQEREEGQDAGLVFTIK